MTIEDEATIKYDSCEVSYLSSHTRKNGGQKCTF